MDKHAYLIIAHNEFDLLKKLIQLLDDERNNIFIHIDKNATNFNVSEFDQLTQKSKLILIDRKPIYWGTYSLVDCELALLHEATQDRHSYYHLLSGADLPLKSQNQIHDFFDKHAGKEFISYHHKILKRESFWTRVKYYHLFQKKIDRKRKISFLKLINKAFLKLQKTVGINRIKHIKGEIKKGEQWFSITHDLACYILNDEKEIKRINKLTLCPSECFLHTVAWNSPYKENIVDNSLRFIDWKRGKPYTFQVEDFNQLVNSDKFWARKFSEQIDPKIIGMIMKHLQSPLLSPENDWPD